MSLWGPRKAIKEGDTWRYTCHINAVPQPVPRREFRIRGPIEESGNVLSVGNYPWWHKCGVWLPEQATEVDAGSSGGTPKEIAGTERRDPSGRVEQHDFGGN